MSKAKHTKLLKQKAIKFTSARSLLTAAALLASATTGIQSAYASQKAISPNLICINPWAPYVPSTEPGPVTWGAINNPNKATFTANTNMWQALTAAKVQMFRIGGNGALAHNKLNTADASGGAVVDLIRSAQATGADILFQVPQEYTTTETKALWDYLNGTGTGQQNLGIKKFSVGNEDKLGISHNNPNITGPYSATTVASNFKRIAKAIKEKDATAKMEFGNPASYDADFALWVKGDGSATDITGKDANGRYYADSISWHRYSPDLTNDMTNIADMQSKISAAATANGRLAADRLKISYTEWNMQYDNTNGSGEDYPWTMKAGQNFADLIGTGMKEGFDTVCLWATVEGGSARDTTGTDLSAFDVSANGLVYTPRAVLQHASMLANNIKANWASSTDDQANVKVIATSGTSGGSAIMLMNVSTTTSYTYSLNLSTGGTTTTSAAVHINTDNGKNAKHDGTIGAYETQMLVFNTNGAMTKKYVYNKANHWTNRIDPTLTSYSPAVGGVSGATEKLTNPAFDNDLSGWTTVPVDPTVYFWSNLTGPDGAAGIMKLDMTLPLGVNANAKNVYQDVTLTAGKTYDLTVSARLAAAGSEAPVFGLRDVGSPFGWYIKIMPDSISTNEVNLTSAANPPPLTSSTTWRTFTGTYTATTTGTFRVIAQVGLTGSGVRIDDFSLTER